MRLLGFYVELSDGDSDLYTGSIVDAVRPTPTSDEASVLEYLKDGTPVIDFMEATPDVIGQGRYIPGGSSILTDGIWIWREDLSYYLATYHLELDDDFLQLAALNSYRSPVLSPQTVEKMVEAVSDAFLC